jgi:hypothetical protein
MNVKAACWHGQGVTLRRPLLIALIGMIVGGGSHCHFTKIYIAFHAWLHKYSNRHCINFGVPA